MFVRYLLPFKRRISIGPHFWIKKLRLRELLIHPAPGGTRNTAVNEPSALLGIATLGKRHAAQTPLQGLI